MRVEPLAVGRVGMVYPWTRVGLRFLGGGPASGSRGARGPSAWLGHCSVTRSNIEVFSGTLSVGATITEGFFIILIAPTIMRE